MSYPWIVEGHKIFRAVLVVQLLLAIVIGLITGEIIPAFVFGIPIVAVPIWLTLQVPNEAISRYAVAIGVQLMAALHIHQAFGLTELHFEVFALLAIVAYYRCWKTVLASTLAIAVYHIGFFAYQSMGGGVHIFEAGKLSLYILLIHAAFAVTEGAVLMYTSYRSYIEGISAATLSNTIDKILANPDKVDFTVTVDTRLPSMQTFGTFFNNIKQLVNDSCKLTDDVSQASEVIRQASAQMSQSSHESSTEITSICAAAEEIATTMNISGEHTQQANTLTDSAHENTSKTHTAIESTKNTIGSLRDVLNAAAQTNTELNERCSSISDAMRSITAVAEQTNLLALNAAIESARAGEHGRGFAVVADEVRTLAIRSKESAEEITSITESLVESTSNAVDQMNTCVSLVDEAVTASDDAVTTMQSIAGEISEVSNVMHQVSQSAGEQTRASSSIAQSTSRMSEIANQEAQTAAELESQVTALTELCNEMHMSMNKFEV